MLPQLVRQFAAAGGSTLPRLTIGSEVPHFEQARLRSTDKVDYSRYPTLNEDELEEDFMRGSGPGGQSVNKTSNCVFLRHLPTNIIVKCHLHRLASKNRVEARRLLLEKLDAHYNGEHAVAAQLKALEAKKSVERKRRQHKLSAMKKNWKEREDAMNESE